VWFFVFRSPYEDTKIEIGRELPYHTVALPIIQDQSLLAVKRLQSSYITYWVMVSFDEGSGNARMMFEKIAAAVRANDRILYKRGRTGVTAYESTLRDKLMLLSHPGPPPEWWIGDFIVSSVISYSDGDGAEIIVLPDGQERLFVYIRRQR
jgi:hypothetical protein